MPRKFFIPSEIGVIPNTKCFYYGTFIYKSYTLSSGSEKHISTMLIRNIVDENNNFVRDHIWVSGNINAITRGLKLKSGDVVRFVGCQIMYRKGFVGCRERYLGNVIATRGTTVKYLNNMVNMAICGGRNLKKTMVPEKYIDIVAKQRIANDKFIPVIWTTRCQQQSDMQVDTNSVEN